MYTIKCRYVREYDLRMYMQAYMRNEENYFSSISVECSGRDRLGQWCEAAHGHQYITMDPTPTPQAPTRPVTRARARAIESKVNSLLFALPMHSHETWLPPQSETLCILRYQGSGHGAREEGQVAEEKEEEEEMLHSFSGRTFRLPTRTVRHEVPETSLPKNRSWRRSPLTTLGSSSAHRPDFPGITRTVRPFEVALLPKTMPAWSRACVSRRTVRLATRIVWPPTQTVQPLPTCRSGQEVMYPLSHLPFRPLAI